MKDKKTTVWGIVSALGVLMIGVAAFMDGDPATIVDMQSITGAIGAVLAALGLGAGGKASKDAS